MLRHPGGSSGGEGAYAPTPIDDDDDDDDTAHDGAATHRRTGISLDIADVMATPASTSMLLQHSTPVPVREPGLRARDVHLDSDLVGEDGHEVL